MQISLEEDEYYIIALDGSCEELRAAKHRSRNEVLPSVRFHR